MQNWDAFAVTNWLRRNCRVSEETVSAFQVAGVDGKRLIALTERQLKVDCVGESFLLVVCVCVCFLVCLSFFFFLPSLTQASGDQHLPLTP